VSEDDDGTRRRERRKSDFCEVLEGGGELEVWIYVLLFIIRS
jgi:hypothetical protein